MTPESKQQRLEICNRALGIIANHGRRFFSLSAEGRTPERECISFFELRAGRLWFVDKYTNKAIYTAYRRGRWSGFSEGGTLRDLVCAMADWITSKRDDFPINHFGPWPEWVCGGDLWGYGPEMTTVREKVRELAI
jgi:hypothetical protein